MAELAGLTEDAETFLCPVCLDYLETPSVLAGCSHAFCAVCVTGQVTCPVCRAPVAPSSVSEDAEQRQQQQRQQQGLEARMRASRAACPGCGASMAVSEMRVHVAGCSQAGARIAKETEEAKAAAAAAAGELQTGDGSSEAASALPANRSTFECPFESCSAANLTCQGLIEHLDSAHPQQSLRALCPVCASMPWNDGRLSGNVVAHIKLRHRFEYDSFVPFHEVGGGQAAHAGQDCSEEALLAAVLARSLLD